MYRGREERSPSDRCCPEGCREVRRHRHPGEQRQRHQPDRHRGHGPQAVRPNAEHQHPGHISCVSLNQSHPLYNLEYTYMLQKDA